MLLMNLPQVFASRIAAVGIVLLQAFTFAAGLGQPRRPVFFSGSAAAAEHAQSTESAQAPAAPDGASITGARLTWGDGVQCPTIQDDEGVVHTVSYLSPGIPIGGRVMVRGYHAVRLSCFGDVLIVEEEIALDR
jgi:hypothetical protein